MNIRLQKYKKNRLSGMNQYNAARAAGYPESTARGKIAKIERSAKVGLADAFEQAGLTDKAIVAHAIEGLQAMKVVNADIYNEEDGEKKKEESALREVKDWTARHKYFETICKLTGRIKDNNNKELSNVTIGNSVQVLIINQADNATNLRDTQERGNGQRVDLGAEAVLRFSKPGS